MAVMLFEDWGLIDYQQALDKQLEYVEKVAADETHPGFLIFCSHPPVVTIGRQSTPEDIFAWKGSIIEISRGGKATYHGPSQVVVYPIINLKNPRAGRGPQEIRGYLRALEQAIVETLATFDVASVGRTPQKIPGKPTATDETGVWIGNRKIASLGIAVKNWITYHGAAINVSYDPEAFMGMNPCGFKTSTMLSLEQHLNKKPNIDEFKKVLKERCDLLL